MSILLIAIAVFMITASFIAIESKDLLSAALILGLVSLLSSVLFIFLQAPDVAMAEASIGAALTTTVFIFAINKTKRFEENEKNK